MKPMFPTEKTPWNRSKRAKRLIAWGLLVMIFDVGFYIARQDVIQAKRAMETHVHGYSFVEDTTLLPYLLVGAAAALAVLAGVVLIASTPEEPTDDP